MPHADVIDLDGAGTVRVDITADGVLLSDLTLAPGWRVLAQHPTPGLLRRRVKPGPSASVTLGDDTGTAEREVEVGRLEDGTWEHAVRRQSPWDGRTVRTPAGDIDLSVADDQPRLGTITPAPGWQVRSTTQDEHDVVVTLARGEEEWEVVLMEGLDGGWLVDLDHRRQLGHIS